MKLPTGKEIYCEFPKSVESSENKPVELNKETFQGLKGKCFQLKMNYWTFEYCYKMKTRQFHQSSNKLDEFNLGNYEKADIVNGTYYQYFSNGTPCDIGKDISRTSIVKFECGHHEMDHLYSVTEEKTCTYMFVFHSKSLCHEKNINKIKCTGSSKTVKGLVDEPPKDIASIAKELIEKTLSNRLIELKILQ
ncbi:hypothetical protein ROZALSC1DRAFT_28725 [Rozella allomycis CSF55]|uniref:Protein OS-9 homolog n=1 Tax=Rozella allomycis (strain CSF55) TaxID=988480 RepID=A0A075APJ5_ROZAC|nr:hypothetical protein O9G_004861 [Rozella allomycis CSF55]RKP19707.1 hypothetical protein ROZALSC1DRAFT_28725 [Rozella allomycis CSF55]|eukprot:EPZ32031.1 hypothetical protein O9G_004861 [Rozella allomycis CSF55]